MNLSILIAALTWAIPTVGLGFILVIDHRGKFSRLRNMYCRLCIPLSSTQVVPVEDSRLGPFQHLFPSSGLANITAIEFIEDPVHPGRKLISQLERLSPSIFPGSILRIWVAGTAVALLIAPILLFVLGSVPQLHALSSSWVSFALTLGAAAATGVLLCFGLVIVASRALFEAHFREIKAEIDRLAVWEPGREPHTNGRKVTFARDDPTYKSLDK